MLIEAGLISEWQLNSALGQQNQWGGRLASVMVDMGFVDEKTVASLLEKQLGQSCVHLEETEIAADILKRMKIDIAKKYCIIPIDFDKGTLTVAMSDPTDLKTLDDLGFVLNMRIKPALALESDIKKAIARHYEGIITGSKVLPVRTIEPPREMHLMSDLLEVSPPLIEPLTPAEAPAEKKEITTKSVVEALVAVLIEKGLITKEEVFQKIKEKGKQG